MTRKTCMQYAKGWMLALCGLCVSCADDVMESPVPVLARVSYVCNVETINAIAKQTKQAALNSPGGYVRIYDRTIITASDYAGVAGLFLLQSYEGVYYAYDLACPQCYADGYTAGRVQRIDMKEDGMTAYCPTCESEFGAVFWGSPVPTKGKANGENHILRQYTARLLPDGVTLAVSK